MAKKTTAKKKPVYVDSEQMDKIVLTREQAAEQKFSDALKKRFALEGHPAEYIAIAGSTVNMIHFSHKGDVNRLIGIIERTKAALVASLDGKHA